MHMSEKLDEKQKGELLKSLGSLGLNDHEALVYMALLKLGETGTSPIIRETALHGQYVYQSLERLEGSGLVQHVIKRGRRKYSAKTPNTLVHLAEERKAQAEAVALRLGEFMTLAPEQTFETYQGHESYVAHEFDMLDRAEEGSELLIMGGSGDRFNAELGKRLSEYVELQTKKKIRIRYIGSDDQRTLMPMLHGKRSDFSVRYLPGLFTGEVNTNIWPDAIGFNIYGDPVARFTVFNPVVATSYRQFFETLWKLAKE